MSSVFKASGLIANATDADILRSDAILTNGSLALLEPGRAASIAAGQTTTVPNIAAVEARRLIPGTSVLDGDLYFSTMPAGVGKFEKTGKGGLHVIMSQTSGTNANKKGAQLGLPLSIRSYLAANPNNKLGVWIWRRKTRQAVSAGAPRQRLQFAARQNDLQYPYHTDQSAALALTFGDAADTFYNPGNASDYYTLSVAESALNVPGRLAGAVKGGWSLASGKTVPTSGADLMALYSMGNVGGGSNDAASNNNSSDSYVIYRMYVEDLTVSGRTPAAVDAIDKAMFDTAFATGGRFNSDTFTDPTTIP